MPNVLQFKKPYTIAMVGDNDAEINMYGEVVEQHPVDWWTGEKVPGNFIALDDFLADLDELGTKDNITVHINSVGGSLYAGLAIYNRLRALSANIITINDSLAASAASIIFQAGNTRKVNAGSNLMIHGAAGFLYGYYQVPDLKSAIKSLESANKTAAAAYAQATGKDAAEIKTLMDKETWMTGQEAVDMGFADELIDDTAGVSMSLSPDKHYIVSNGIAMRTCCMGAIPSGVAQMSAEEWAQMSTRESGEKPHQTHMQPAAPDSINTQTEENTMEFKNVDELRSALPELMAQVENDARAAGAQAERERLQGIEAIEAAVGDADLIKNAKYGETTMTAEQLALAAMKKQAAIGAQMLTKMEADAHDSGVEAVEATPAEASEPTAKTEDEQAVEMLVGSIPANMRKEDK